MTDWEVCRPVLNDARGFAGQLQAAGEVQRSVTTAWLLALEGTLRVPRSQHAAATPPERPAPRERGPAVAGKQ